MNSAVSALNAATRGRQTRCLQPLPLALALATCSLLTLATPLARAQALPGGLNVVHGQAQVNTAGKTMTVTNSNGAILNWQSFNIAAGQTVRFQQAGASSQVLNRVVGKDASSIFGNLTSNGKVWLLNPNGVLFGQSARINVAGLVVSTLNLADNDFINNRYSLTTALADMPGADIVNQGELRTTLGGRVALLGGNVRNEGLIEAPGGQVLLAAGRSIDLVDTGVPNLTLRVQAPEGEALNMGSLAAPGGRVDLQAAIVNQQGLVRADALSTGAGGEVVLRGTQAVNLAAGSSTQANAGTAEGARAGRVTMDAGTGTALVSGEVSATSANGAGGRIDLLGHHVGLLDGATLDVSGARGGGAIFMGGGERGQDLSLPNAAAAYVAPTASLRADALQRGDGGRIVVWSDDATRAYGQFSARGGPSGGDGGFIETSGGWLDARPSSVSAAAPAGRPGQWLLDPNNLRIVNGDSNDNISAGPDFTTTDNDAVIGTILITNALEDGISVTIETGNGGVGGQAGDITMIGAQISVAPETPASLTLTADRNIIIQDSLIESTGPALDVNLSAARGGVGSINLTGSQIITGGGNVSLGGTGRAVGPRASAPFLAAVGYDAPDGPSRRDGVRLENSRIDAGEGRIAMQGATAPANAGLTGASGVFIGGGSTLAAADVSIDGWIDSQGTISGVDVFGADIDATHSITINGTALSQRDGTGNVSGTRLFNANLRVQPEGRDTSAALTINGTTTVGGAADPLIEFGVWINESGGEQLLVSGGGSLSITGTMDSALSTIGVAINGPLIPGAVAIDASAASSLSIRSTGPQESDISMFQTGIAVPDGGTATIDSDYTLFFSGTAEFPGFITGSPSTFSLHAGERLQLADAALSFTGAPQLSIRAGGPTAGGALDMERAQIDSDGPVGLFGGSITFVGDAAVTSTAPGDAIVLAGANDDNTALFRNASGSSALSTPAGRWLIYADEPSAAFTPGDLPNDFRQYAADFGALPVAGGNGFLFSLAPGVSLTGTPTKVYDGNTAIALTPVQVSAGLVEGDTAAIAQGATGTLADKNAGTNKLVTVPGGSITFTDANDKPVFGYTVGPLFGVVSPKPLTVANVAVADKAYDGLLGATVTSTQLDGLVGAETLSVTAAASFDSKDAGADKPVTVGLTLSNGTNGGLLNNYSIASTTAQTTATIAPKSVSLVATTALDKKYDGNTLATVEPGSLDGLVGSETLGVTGTGTFDDKDAGTAKTVTLSGFDLANGANGGLASNYTLSGAPATTTADITPKPVTVGNFVAADKTYDRTTLANISGGDVQGLVAGESLTLSATGNFDTRNAGIDKTVTVDYVLGNSSTGGLASNYSFTAGATATADVIPKAVTVDSAVAASKSYDGNTVAEVTAGPVVGLIGAETLVVNASGNFDTKDAATGKTVVMGYRLADGGNGGLAGNYTLTSAPASTTADITPKALTIAAAVAANKVYDGNTLARVTASTPTGLVGNETLGVVAGGNYDTKDAAKGKTVSLGFTLVDGANGGLASNYAVTSAPSTTLADITPKAVTLDSVVAANRDYNGNTIASVTTGPVNGLIGAESLVVNGNGSFDTKDAGTGKTVTLGYALADGANGGLADNYTLATAPATTNADITPKQVTVSGLTVADKVYDGTTVASASASGMFGLVGAETLAVDTRGSFDTRNAGTGKPVAVAYALADGQNGGLASNYALSADSATASAAIIPKAVTISSVSAADKSYDGNTLAAVSFGAVEGLVGAETLTVNGSGNFEDRNAATGKTVVTRYSLADGANGGLSNNYRVVTAPTTTTADITPKALTVAGVSAADKRYDGNTLASITLGATQGLVGSETLAIKATGSFDNKDAGSAKTVVLGYSVADGNNGGLAGNYTLTPPPATTLADITPQTLTVAVAAADKVYDGSTAATLSAAAVSGLVGAETLALTATGSFDNRQAGSGKTVAVSGFSASDGSNGGLASNYSVTGVPATTTADITPKALNVVSLTVANKVYDGNTTADATGWALDGVIASDQVAVGAGTASFTTAAAGSGKPVQGTASGLAGADAANYTLGGVTGTGNADITLALLTYVAAPASGLVGAALPPLGGTVEGFVAQETQASATTGQLAWTTPVTPPLAAGAYAVQGSGLAAPNYVFTQAASNSTALRIAGVAPTLTPATPTVAALNSSLAAVTLSPAVSNSSQGRVLDLMPAVQAGGTSQTMAFVSLPVASLSQDALAGLLASRESYKNNLFAGALSRLDQNSALADTPACSTMRQLLSGDCLVTEALMEQVAAAKTAPTGTTAMASANTVAPNGSLDPEALIAENPTAAAPLAFPGKRSVKTAALPQIQRKVALLIGVDKYADVRIPQLENAVSDARAVAKVLDNSLGYETVVLENASKRSVVKALNQLALEINPHDSVVIYYAGHGALASGTGLGYWQLADSDADRPESWLSNTDINKAIAQFGASQVALISDSCYSGSLVDKTARGNAAELDVGKLLERKAVVVMSSGGNEPVFDSGRDGHSTFAWNLMDTLEKLSNWQAGSGVFERVRFAVAKELPQRPQYGAAAAAGHQAGAEYLFERRQLSQ